MVRREVFGLTGPAQDRIGERAQPGPHHFRLKSLYRRLEFDHWPSRFPWPGPSQRSSSVRVVRLGLNGRVVPAVVASNARRRRGRRGHADVNDDWIGIDRRLVRDVVGVPQKDLQSVTPFRQGEGRLCLTAAEMQVVLIVRDRLIQWREWRVDQEVVMAGVRLAAEVGVGPNRGKKAGGERGIDAFEEVQKDKADRVAVGEEAVAA